MSKRGSTNKNNSTTDGYKWAATVSTRAYSKKRKDDTATATGTGTGTIGISKIPIHNIDPKIPSVKPTPATTNVTLAHSSQRPGTAVIDIDGDGTAVEEQKERAKKFWNASNYNEEMKVRVNDDVMQYLDQGLVLPIFHTLCCPPDQRLFPPAIGVGETDRNLYTIQLSSVPVTMGNSEHGTQTVSEISMGREMPYIPAFVSKTGNGNFFVKDLNFQWKFDENYTNYITELVNAPAIMVGEDIEVTKLVEPLDIDRKSGRNLITRRLSRGVVADCFARSEMDSTYAIVGSPGVGKSWTLIYALQQALLYENACVLLCFQKDNMAIVCVRRNNMIFVWICKDPSFSSKLDSLLFLNSNVLVLLDPRESTEGGASFVKGPRMLIMAASNNADHFKSIGKFTGDYARILSCYTDKELKCAMRFMKQDTEPVLSMVVMLDRASKIGNLPRYILSETLFNNRLKETAKAIRGIANDDVKEILNFDGICQSGSTIPGCIFAVNVCVDDVSSQANDVVGYDGQFVLDYEKLQLTIISKSVRADIIKSNRKFILSYWGKVQDSARIEMGNMVEDLLWNDLKEKYCMKLYPFRMSKKKNHATDDSQNAEGADDDEEAKEEMFQFNMGMYKCNYHENVTIQDLGKKVFIAEPPMICRMAKNSALIDFAGPGSRVYQVTVRENHDMSKSGLKELFLSSGHCEERPDGTIAISKNAANMNKIMYLWVVPHEIVSKWGGRVSKTIYDENDVSVQSLKHCLDTYVEQYILTMYVDPFKVTKTK